MATQSAKTVYEATVAKIYAPTGLPYTPTQVVNSLVRAHSHVVRHGNAVEAAVYGKAVKLAKVALDKAHKEGYVPCGADCLNATVVECVCHCGGKNHGKAHQAQNVDTDDVTTEVSTPAKKGAAPSKAAQDYAIVA